MLKNKQPCSSLALTAALSAMFVAPGCLIDSNLDEDVEISQHLGALHTSHGGDGIEAPAIDVRINDIPISVIDKQGLGSVDVERVNGGTQWRVAIGGDTFVVTEGRAAVEERIGALILALGNDSRISADQRNSAADELRIIESRLETRSTSIESATDCRGSLNFTPSFQRNMWYGRVDSTLSWSMWPGPVAPWQNWIYARAVADGNTYDGDSGWKSYGPFGTTAGVSVTASTGVGPESTYGIVLYAYAYFDSTGCLPLWFEQVNKL